MSYAASLSLGACTSRLRNFFAFRPSPPRNVFPINFTISPTSSCTYILETCSYYPAAFESVYNVCSIPRKPEQRRGDTESETAERRVYPLPSEPGILAESMMLMALWF